MIITYIRSSSWTTDEWCEHKYYQDYVLGYKSEPNIKAAKGNILHKTLECLAQYKLALQNKETEFTNDSFEGKIQVNEVECNPRVLCDRAYDYYSKLEHKLAWSSEEREDCWQWVKAALEFQKGRFDPRNNNIVSPEQQFDIEIPHGWASYEYKLNNEVIAGQLRIKGTIDLLQQPFEGAYEIQDYKSGRRFDWVKGVEKDAAKLDDDFQLKLYYYAARKLYPHIKDILVTIIFFRDGGAHTCQFTDETVKEVEHLLKEKFYKIKGSTIPRLNKRFDRWRTNCNWCQYSKNKIGDKSQCEHIHSEILKKGIKKTTEEYMQNKTFITYSDGGGRQARDD
jgi:hypothetical protein